MTERFERTIRVSYSKTEIVERVSDLEHELVREALRVAGIPHKIEVVTIADVPARGTGLGSSSAVTVGLLNALFSYQGILKSPAALAEDAARIEIDVAGKPIGRQDHYACAFGGLQLLRFGPDNSVSRHPVIMGDAEHHWLERNLMMFYTGRQRAVEGILGPLGNRIEDDPEVRRRLVMMRDLALGLYEGLGNGYRPDQLGECLHENWQLKRSLDKGISDDEVDELYARALDAGAIGGKLLGAGGGGFLLFYVPADRQPFVRQALGNLRELPFRFEPEGSRIVHVSR